LNTKFFALLLITGFVFSVYSISDFATAASPDIGKVAPTEKISPNVSPPGFEKSGMIRVISSATSEQEISDIQQKGCFVVHRLNQATSFSCPSKAVDTMDNVKPVRIFYPHGLDSATKINAPQVWNLDPFGFTGSGVTVVVLDTGVQVSHAELQQTPPISTVDCTVEGEECEEGGDLDFNGHGTHVSGIIASSGHVGFSTGSTKGVAPDANLLVGKVCGPEVCMEDDIINGIEWAEAQGADVINMSLGGRVYGGANCDPEDPNFPELDELLEAAVYLAAEGEDGVVFTISSGNDYAKNGVSSPACVSKAIAVGSTDGNRISGFSNTGPAMDVVAPGSNVFSTYSCNAINDPNYLEPCIFIWAATLSGTSMSAPHVAGVVALMLEKNPYLTVDDVETALCSTATKIQNGRYDGCGRVDALAAVNSVSATPIAPSAPGKPTSLLATAGDSQVSLSWTAPTSNGGSPITDYIIQYRQNGSTGWNTFDDGIGTLTSATVTTLTNEVLYDFQVLAKNNAGTSIPSNLVSETPSTPSITTATVTYDTEGGRDGTKHLLIFVNLDSVISNAAVTIQIYYGNPADPLNGPITEITDSNGNAKFALKNASSGSYTTAVTEILSNGVLIPYTTSDPGFPKP